MNQRKNGPKRIVVTGAGAVTPAGLSARETCVNLLAGRSGGGRITSFDPSGLPVHLAAEVKGFDPRPYMDHRPACSPQREVMK